MLPFIDVVFLLLIFFIYAMLSMAVHRGMELDLPESSSATLTKDEVLSISVKRYGASGNELVVQINDRRVSLAQLGEEIQRMSLSGNDKQALIFAEESISYQELFLVLDQVKVGGITAISLQANRAGK